MALTVGTQLGSHEITALLGKGGMGEVYRARDLKLKREVAIKILPEEFSRDVDRVSRFQREAEVLASLNHPNIAGIHDLAEANGSRYIVLELVEGETLADRIALGRIPVDEALNIAIQICEALEAAHEKGIIHRDLKPANIKLTPDGSVKILDFGLAKALENTAGSATSSNSPTMLSGTMGGMILGTAAYMSPEQARGINVDHRTDIWAFGSVLYEMLSARQAFHGELVSDVLAAVLAREVDYTLLPSRLHPRLKDALRRCLEKDRKRRWQAMGDVRVEIQDVMADPHGADVQAVRVSERRPLWKRVIPIVVTAIVVAAVTLVITSGLRTAPQTTVTRFPFIIPEGQQFNRNSGRHVLAISPAGTDVVYVADNQLYLRKMSEMESRRIQGTEPDVAMPFFSPNGQWLGFYSISDNKLKKIAIAGGAAITIADAPTNPNGISWNGNDQILIGAGSRGILGVSGTGGKVQTVIKVEADEQAQSPQLLPDGENLLFTLGNGGTTVTDRWGKAQIVVQSLKTGRRQVVVEGGSDARYVPTGHILYHVGTNVLAVPFDAKNLRLTGGPIPVLEGVARSQLAGIMQLSFSNNGTIGYVPDGGFGSGLRVLLLDDSVGQEKTLPLPPSPYFHPRISPNGKQIVVTIDDGKDASIWLYDLDGSTTLRRLTFAGANRYPIWSPDGQRIVFQSDREKDLGLFWQRADGSGTAERLTTAEGKKAHAPQAWMPDGKTLIFSVIDGSGDGSVWSVSVEPGSKPKLLLDRVDAANRSAALSADGRWIAYASNEAGRNNIFVQPVPPTGAKYQITTDRGISPIWSSDGKHLIYSENPGGGLGNLKSVDIQTRPSFVFGKPVPLPIKEFWHNGLPGEPRGFDMTPDGKQFIVMRSPDLANSRQSQQINIILNWFTELQQRIPVK
jgi:serine/threonine-protein kinase